MISCRLCEGTKILMADGNNRNIESLSIGESVMLSNGKKADIKHILKGSHCYYYLDIMTESGLKAFLPPDYCILLEGNCWMGGFDIIKGLYIQTQYGVSEIVDCTEVEYGGTFYFLCVDNDIEDAKAGFYADNIAVSDYINQWGLIDC